jgi:RloB-like protein
MKRNKLYTRREPIRDSKLCYVFCEGEKRETTYFYFFNSLASQIVIQIVPISNGKNSPIGLYDNACKALIKSNENLSPSYDLDVNDEVWFIIDTDKWEKEIETLRSNLNQRPNWFVAQSNPCFEVWLYYHISESKPTSSIPNWKKHLGEIVAGGFDNRKHPKYIETAIANSKANFLSLNNKPAQNATEVFLLAQKILPLVKSEIDEMLLNTNSGESK